MSGFSANGTFLYKYTFPLQKGELIHCVEAVRDWSSVFLFLNAKSADSPLLAVEKRILNSFSSKEVVRKRGCFWISCSGTLHLKLSGLVEL